MGRRIGKVAAGFPIEGVRRLLGNEIQQGIQARGVDLDLDQLGDHVPRIDAALAQLAAEHPDRDGAFLFAMQDDDGNTEFLRALAALQDTHRVPGVGVVWIAAGSISDALGRGVAVTGSDREVSNETLFQAASLSKPVFALGVLQLAARGASLMDGGRES